MAIKGIDVSKWQSSIDWQKVRAGGISFAIIRASYMQTADPKFSTHIQGALAAGLEVGVYCYAKSTNVTDAVSEADFILSLIKPFRVAYPVFYDMEDAALAALTMQERTDIAAAFCERIEGAGYYAAIYANKNWLENMLDYSRLKVYDIWLAQWTTQPTWTGNYGIWQYGQEIIDGVGNCDCNIAYRDYPKLITAGKLNNTAAVLSVGSRIRYSGKVQYSSWGIGKTIQVNGTYTVKRIIKNRKYGVQIDGLGWVAESACKLV